MKLVISGSEHHARPDAPAIAAPPADREAWDALLSMTRVALKELGLRGWCPVDDPDWPLEQELMLLPGAWYRYIPAGFPIVSLRGVAHVFEPGVSDDDIRSGFLPYGVLAVEE